MSHRAHNWSFLAGNVLYCLVQYPPRSVLSSTLWVGTQEAIVTAATETEQPVVGRSAQKRQAILHAAGDLFLQKGYAGFRM